MSTTRALILALAATFASGCFLPDTAPVPDPVEDAVDGGEDTLPAPPTPACGMPSAPGGRCCLGVQPCSQGYTCVGTFPTWYCQ